MSRLKSRSSSKSERAIVISVQDVLAIASVERSERSKIAISPKQAPGLRTASASSPDPGMVREMRTSPSEIMKSRLPGSPSLKTCWPTANFCSRHTSDTRASAVLDPTADKVFMAAAFFTVARTGLLHPLEIVGVLARDIVAALGYVGAWLWRRPTALPARAGGKAVTVLQLLTLVAFIARSPLVRPLAWATAAVGLYAIWDYGRAGARARATPTRGKGA